MNKKGYLLEGLSIIGFLFMMGFVSLLVVYIMAEINTEVQSDNDFTPAAKTLFANQRTQLPGLFDWWFGLFLVGLPLVSAGLAYFNDIHPVFFWIALPVIMISIFLGAAYAEVWNAACADATLASYCLELPIQNAVLSNYGKYSLFVVFVIALGTFVKLRGGGVQRDLYGGLG